MSIEKIMPYLVVIIVFTLLLLFYTAYDKSTKTLMFEKLVKVLSFQDITFSLKELNKVIALESIGLIAMVFLLGPLSRVWPIFGRFLYLRKPVGLMGFGLAVIHGVYSSIEFYQLDVGKIFFENPKVIGIIAGFIALVIFFLMSITSSKEMEQRMGYKKWKALQTFGYVGLFFALIHFFVLETKPEIGLDVRPFGLLFFYIPIIAILARLLVIFITTPEKKSYEEHVGEKPRS